MAILILSTTAALRLSNEAEQVRADVAAEMRSGPPAWSERVDQWAYASRVEPYALEAREAGNAAAILWPRGFMEEPLRCPRMYPQAADSPIWERDRDAMLAAASCEHLDRFVRAARLERFDVLDPAVRRDASVADLRFSRAAYRGVLWGVGALLSRARLRSERGDTAGAERDLRALISLGLTLVRSSPNPAGLEHGHRAIDYGLSHLTVLRAGQGLRGEAARIEEMRDGLPPLERSGGLITGAMPYTASVPAGFPPVAKVVERADVPLSIRLGALQGIRLGYTNQPWRLLFGPSRERSELARDLGREEALRPWWKDMDGHTPSLDHKARVLFSMLL